MCKYCHFEENGNAPDDYKFFPDVDKILHVEFEECAENLDRPVIKATLEMPMCFTGHVWKHPDPVGYVFNVNVHSDYDPPFFTDFDIEFPIRYCPMCGRKLWKQEETYG